MIKYVYAEYRKKSDGTIKVKGSPMGGREVYISPDVGEFATFFGIPHVRQEVYANG